MNTQKRIATLVLASMILSTATTFSIDSAQFGSLTKFARGFESGACEVFGTVSKNLKDSLSRISAENLGQSCGEVTAVLTIYAATLAGVFAMIIAAKKLIDKRSADRMYARIYGRYG